MDSGLIIFMSILFVVSALVAWLIRKFSPNRNTEPQTRSGDFVIKRFFLGDFHLVPTYVISAGGFIFFEFLINNWSHSFFTNEAILTLSIFALIFAAIPIWKSANKFKGNSFFALLAQASMIFGLAVLSFLLHFLLTFEL